MSTSALFGNSAVRNASKNLVEFKAGKMIMKGKIVYPDSRKGQLYVYQSDDSLMHFCWKDRSTGVVEDDLIIFPDDCEFKYVSQCKTGRVYLLKFKSSSRKFFFWLQDVKTEKDEEYCRKINEVLNNPPAPGSQRSSGANPEGDIQNLLSNMSQQQLMQLFGVGQIGSLGNLLGNINRPFSGNRISTPTSLNPVTTSARSAASLISSPVTTEAPTQKSTGNNISHSTRTDTSLSSSNDDTRIRLTDLQNFLSGITPHCSEQSFQGGMPNELSTVISAAFVVNENLEKITSKYLPPGDNLSTTLSSPQFSQALSLFWTALESGQAAPVIQQFGLSSEVVKAATTGNILQFIIALEDGGESHRKNSSKSVQEENQDKSQQHQQSSQISGSSSEPKKDDDDEGMALD
ncbi:proteasomal ubiquitin receptor ADRM1-like isoform X2 [Phymastichus coffea]|uniref:proteasomal ubiquitin receptor ADRM1-like isoform X2 n=1 Tax=Phymastichus coffea TaxID=108790 RepID=UPI00273AE099|nr:proteasomal ubiquitin receptor ADRM1-like isoform X2 [Phymastichus coffea]